IPSDQTISDWLLSQVNLINQFAKLAVCEVSVTASKPGLSGSSVVMGNQVYLHLEGLIDVKVEIERLTKEIARVQNLIEGSKKRLQNENFVSRAPKDVIEKEREKQQGLEVNLEKLQKNLAAFEK
ncbi:MAG: hypothetical protein Q4F84_03680, partial [Fibrobacter sp.]|nr:hypothetical protein [Fibrobacter sp.]